MFERDDKVRIEAHGKVRYGFFMESRDGIAIVCTWIPKRNGYHFLMFSESALTAEDWVHPL